MNLIEIDLTRQGAWHEMLLPAVVPHRIRTAAYCVMTRRAHRKRQIELYPINLRQRLPVVAVPLRASDPDAPLALQDLLDRAYRNGRYDRTRYDRPCDPPLEADDAAWADELLRAAGRR